MEFGEWRVEKKKTPLFTLHSSHFFGEVFILAFTLTIILVCSAVLAVIDQVIKYFVLHDLAPVGQVSVIDGLFSLVYVENRGIAFGMFQGMFWIFSLLTVALIGVFIYMIVKKTFTGKLFYIASALIIGGGIGNLIDRVFRGFVIDYLSISFFPPVCNFADYCVTIGAVLLAVSVIAGMKGNKHE